MSHRREVKLLRRRAKGFFARAMDSLNYKDYDLAAFLFEQAVQLYLKSVLLEKVGDYPRTHSLSTLLSLLKRAPGTEGLVELLERRRVELGLMEDAYIASRYLVREYSEEEAKVLMSLAREVLSFG